MKSPEKSRRPRLAAHGAVSTWLSLCSDRKLRELVDAATPVGSGIGGTTVLLEVDRTPVFVKQVRLTDLELQAENVHSTANLFELPLSCHYGLGSIGSPGFGAWRELAVHTMTTNWVIAGDYEGFPLMYHWRVLPGTGEPLPDELADVEQAVDYWGGGQGIRHRIEALQESSASLFLFLEYFPHNLHDWLSEPVKAGDEAAARACAMVDSELEAGISFMNAHGLLHFDAHFENILTDGQRLYFADYGLAISSRFELAPAEADFFAQHRSYDRCYTATHLVNWLAVALHGHEPEERRAFVRSCAQGMPGPGTPPAIAALLVRHAPIAAVMGDFYRQFQREDRATPYPLEAIRRVEKPDDAPESTKPYQEAYAKAHIQGPRMRS
ncbi:serine/threonine-protein kinase [Natronoglycomyces albus]|uniref:Serine/threonine protein kinase n=1 Tax=Natronoglycomyces albus TaxID=2811108 RepID=A0A895XIC3_9ACTN|nr:serine/threonine-protein kinase [Natronoglycomyces albus]QSB04707.1 serine/threonine protein kinase [Natronoglycomyces albus]